MVARDADVLYFPGFLRFQESFQGTAFAFDLVDILLRADIVELPQVKMVYAHGLKSIIEVGKRAI